MHLAPQLTDSGEYISALSEARALRHLRRELERLAAEAESNPVERNFV